MSEAKQGDRCRFYVSPEKPECGDRAVAEITTRITKSDQAKVPLCLHHKRLYDNQMAKLRTASKQVHQ